MPNGAHNKNLERGELLVDEFLDRFGGAYRALAEHAALPAVLTPELVNYLHGEFLRHDLPNYEATADLLLSELCREIGYEQYAMDRDARAHLLAGMRGRDAEIQAIAQKLLGYVGFLARSGRAYQFRELKSQQWAAMVFLDDTRETAVRDLAERIRECLLAEDAGERGGPSNRAELARLARVVEENRAQLGQYQEFVEAAQLIGQALTEASGEPRAERVARESVTVAGIELPVQTLFAPKRKPALPTVPALARELVLGEVVKGFIDIDPIQPKLFETMAVPVRAVINLGEVGMGIAPVTDFLYQGRPYANSTQFETFQYANFTEFKTFQSLVDAEFDFIVTHPKDSEGFYGLAKITRYDTSTWEHLEELAEEDPVIGRLIEGAPRPVIEVGPVRMPLIDPDPVATFHSLLGREIPVLIHEWNRQTHAGMASFHDAIEIEQRRRRQRSLDELIEGCVVEGRVKLTLDKESHAVDLGGLIGRLPHDEVSWLPESESEDPIKIGERILVKVLEIDRGRKTIRLSRKQLLPEPATVTVESTVEVSQLLAELQRLSRALLTQVWRITETQREINALDAQSGEEWERLNRRLIEETRERLALADPIAQLITELRQRQTTPPSTVESFLIQTVMSDLERFGERRDELWTYVHDYLRAVESDDAEAEVRALADIARIFSTIEELPPAITLYRFAAERADERQLLELDIYDRIASCHERMGNLADAETYYEMALNLAMARPSELKSKQLHGHRMLGNLSERTDRFDKALDHFNYALHLAGDLEDNEEQVSILTQIASVHLRRGDRQRLIDTLQSALKIARTLEDKDQEARVRTRLGHAFLDAGEFRTAVEQYGTAAEIAQDANTQLSAFSGLAHAQFRQGHWGEADTFFRRTLRIAESQGDETWIATTLDMLGLTHLEMTDYPGSLEFYERALRMYERRNERSQTAGMLARMGRVHTEAGDAQEAFDCYRQAALIFANLGERSDEAAMSEACARALDSMFDLVEIPGGEFLMGSNEYDREKPIHRVKLSPYFIGKVPVTQVQWKAVMGSDPSRFKGDDLPVENVSWEEAVKFCQELSTQTGKTFRLPTEAEWEMACRAGSTGKYCFGDDEKLLGEYAWYRKNSGSKTHPVGQKKANAWGLFDMHGNVWEWCADWYDGNYYVECERQGVASDPQGPATGSVPRLSRRRVVLPRRRLPFGVSRRRRARLPLRRARLPPREGRPVTLCTLTLLP